MRWKSNQGCFLWDAGNGACPFVLILRAPDSWDSCASASEVWATQVRRHIRMDWSDLPRACGNSRLRHSAATAPQNTGVCIHPWPRTPSARNCVSWHFRSLCESCHLLCSWAKKLLLPASAGLPSLPWGRAPSHLPRKLQAVSCPHLPPLKQSLLT